MSNKFLTSIELPEQTTHTESNPVSSGLVTQVLGIKVDISTGNLIKPISSKSAITL